MATQISLSEKAGKLVWLWDSYFKRSVFLENREDDVTEFTRNRANAGAVVLSLRHFLQVESSENGIRIPPGSGNQRSLV